MNRHKNYILEIANSAGVTINGNQPWDMQVHNEDLYKEHSLPGDIGPWGGLHERLVGLRQDGSNV